MDRKNIKEMSNNEILLYKKELSDEFEITKAKIEQLCDTLKNIDDEYAKVENELKIRGNSLY